MHVGDKNKASLNASLFKKYIHEIRNMRTLDEEMINNIRNMSSEEKMEIIISFNVVVDNMKVLLDY